MLGIHSTLQAAFAVPEFELSEPEAKELAKAYTDVAQFYPAMRLADNVTAMMNFGSVVAIVYGARISAWKMRRASERARSVNKTPLPVSPFVAQPPPQPGNGSAPADKVKPVSREVRTGEIPGVGNIEFPEDHPLMGGRKPH